MTNDHRRAAFVTDLIGELAGFRSPRSGRVYLQVFG